MQQKVQHYIFQNNLPQPPARLIVGVSGGADSVALLHVLVSLGYNCVIAHCNFKLRAAESDRDEAFVANLAVRYSLPYYNITFDTKAYARKNSISIEMAARDLRYAWFEKLRVECSAEAIAVAHHANDVVETYLMNVVRGTGLRGLTGIKPVQGKVIRPFLSILRQEIEAYLVQENLEFVTDSSNLELDYTRNKYRNAIIPLMEEINPSLCNTILEEIRILNDSYLIYNSKVDELRSTLMKPTENGFVLHVEALKQQAALFTLLYEFLSPYGFGSDMIPQVLDLMNAATGKVIQSDTHCLLKDRERILLYPLKENAANSQEYFIYPETIKLDEPFKLTIQKLTTSDIEINKASSHAYLDFDKLNYPLKLRKWRAGDSFIPYGMKGSKKLSDFLIDVKISSLDKQSIWVLESANQIAWLVGMRTDNRFAVSDKTSTVLHLFLC